MGDSTDFDPKELLAATDGDVELAVTLIGVYRAEVPGMLEAIRASVAAGDARTVNRSAHAFKGSVGVMGSRTCTEAALALERMGRDGNLDGAREALATLESAANRLDRSLAHFLDQQVTG